MDDYERWRVAQEANGGSSTPASDSAARAEAARRRREEELHAQEMKQTRQVLEASRIEDEHQRYEAARRGVEEHQRRAQEERRSRETQYRDATEAQRVMEARQVPQQERASPYRPEEEARRADERRRQEQEGILRRQQEAEAAAKEVRRQIVTSSTLSAQPRVDPAGYYRRSQEPETPARTGPPMAIATPQPSRPSSSLRGYNDQYNGAPPRSQDNQASYSHDAGANGGSDPTWHWDRSMPLEHVPTKPRYLPPGYVSKLSSKY